MESTHESVESVENLVRRIVCSMRETNNCTTSRDEQRSHTQQQELNRVFNLPRGSVVGQSQSSPSPTTSTSPIQTEGNGNPPQGEVLRYQYNPRVNYGYTNYNNRNVRRAARSLITPYARNRSGSSPAAYSSGKSSSKRVEPPTFKEIILLPHPGYTDVPKYKKKSDLHKQGLIVDSVPIERSWTEKELKEQIQSIFEKKLDYGNIGYV